MRNHQTNPNGWTFYKNHYPIFFRNINVMKYKGSLQNFQRLRETKEK